MDPLLASPLAAARTEFTAPLAAERRWRDYGRFVLLVLESALVLMSPLAAGLGFWFVLTGL